MTRMQIFSGVVVSAIIVMIGAALDSSSTCVTERRTHQVSGSSLTGLIEHSSTITAVHGYYACHPVMREDIVLAYQPSSKVLLLKVVKAVPGDRWRLVEVDGGAQLEVNGEIATNSLGERYLFQKKTVLSLYEQSTGGAVPADSYIILGNLDGGTLDSTRFGFVQKADLRAHVDRAVQSE